MESDAGLTWIKSGNDASYIGAVSACGPGRNDAAAIQEECPSARNLNHRRQEQVCDWVHSGFSL